MKPREIHGKAEVAREKGDFALSLSLLSESLISYQQEGDYLGLSDALNSVFLTYKHLYYLYRDDVYIVLAKHSVNAAVEIAEGKSNESACALPYYNLAQFLDEFENNYSEAINYYKKAIEIMKSNPPEEHKGQLPAFLHYMLIHMHEAEYKNSDKSAVDKIQSEIDKIAEHPHEFERDVWMSGGYMKIAQLLQNEDPDRSKNALQKAKEIIDNNERLTIRSRQWQELAELLK